jgi:hypothetical protein
MLERMVEPWTSAAPIFPYLTRRSNIIRPSRRALLAILTPSAVRGLSIHLRLTFCSMLPSSRQP